jgi:diguanylate cyclase (GGDEF)-like protein
MADLNVLVRAASLDVHDTGQSQVSLATGQLVREGILLLILLIISLGGVVVGSRFLSDPIERLADFAQLVEQGEFEVPRLSVGGPREVARTIDAFNDMTETLRGIETKTRALGAEDMTNPVLDKPLPGRVGIALQSAVDLLSRRMTEREEQRRQLYDAATYDRLTGLLNRSAVIDFLDHDVTRRREAGETVAVLFVDIDELKQINDLYGHEAGDAAIKATGSALREATGPTDVIGRLGGDEFLVILGADESEDGAAVAERIRIAVSSKTIEVKGFSLPLRCSVGVALARCDSETDPMELMRRADGAMYEAKKAARAARDRLAAQTTKEEATAGDPAVA